MATSPCRLRARGMLPPLLPPHRPLAKPVPWGLEAVPVVSGSLSDHVHFDKNHNLSSNTTTQRKVSKKRTDSHYRIVTDKKFVKPGFGKVLEQS